MKDIGTGGFEGFRWNVGTVTKEIYYYRGGHSAPLAKTNLPNLASYVLTGHDPEILDLTGWAVPASALAPMWHWLLFLVVVTLLGIVLATV